MIDSRQAQTGTPAPPPVDPTLAFRFESLTMEIQWKGGVAIGVFSFIVLLVVCLRDLLGVFDFGNLSPILCLGPEYC